MPRAIRLVAGEIAVIAGLALAIEALARAAIALDVVPEKELRLTTPLVVKPHPFLAFALRPGAVRGAGTPAEQRIAADGFRGKPLGPREPGSFLVACVGDSVTYGDGLGESETMPAALEAAMRAKWPRRRVDVLNAGVLQYTSAETFSGVALRVLDRKPDVVIWLEGANDVAPRLVEGFRSDYAHYRAVWTRDWNDARDRWLVPSDGYVTLRWLARVYPAAQRIDAYTIRALPPRSEAEQAEFFARSSPEPFARNERAGIALANAAGARALVVAPALDLSLVPAGSLTGPCLQQFRDEEAKLSAGERAAFLDLSRFFEGKPGMLCDPVHLTPEGARRVAARLLAELERLGWVPR